MRLPLLPLLQQYKFQLDISDSRALSLFCCTTKLRLFKNVVYIVIAVIVVIIAVYFALRQTDISTHISIRRQRLTHIRTQVHACLQSTVLAKSLFLSLFPSCPLSYALPALLVIRIITQQNKLRSSLLVVVFIQFYYWITFTSFPPISQPASQPQPMTMTVQSAVPVSATHQIADCGCDADDDDGSTCNALLRCRLYCECSSCDWARVTPSCTHLSLSHP